eukprot:364798-Chlamydomonas_euryale.AAC.9
MASAFAPTEQQHAAGDRCNSALPPPPQPPPPQPQLQPQPQQPQRHKQQQAQRRHHPQPLKHAQPRTPRRASIELAASRCAASLHAGGTAGGALASFVDALVCPICLEVAQTPVNVTCFVGCEGTHAKGARGRNLSGLQDGRLQRMKGEHSGRAHEGHAVGGGQACDLCEGHTEEVHEKAACDR